MSGSNFSMFGEMVGDLIPVTSEQITQAQRYIASRAMGADDLRLLLDMLNIREAA